MTVHAPEDKAVLRVEVCLRPESGAELAAVRAAALAFLSSLPSVRYAEGPLTPPPGQHPLLDAHVASLAVVDLSERLPPGKLLLQWDVQWQVGAACWDAGQRACLHSPTPHHHTMHATASARCTATSWMGRGLRMMTRAAMRARPPTASGPCQLLSSTAPGRRWCVPRLPAAAAAAAAGEAACLDGCWARLLVPVGSAVPARLPG